MIINTRSGLKRGAFCKHSKKPLINNAESKFVVKAISNGFEVINKGWPDFLLFKGDKLFAVEVKNDTEQQTLVQKEVMAALTRAGIKCLVWRPTKGFRKFTGG